MTRLTISIDFDNGHQFGHGKIRLLEQTAEHGSISGAARAMNMSYRRAWLLADEVNGMFAQPVMETQQSGAGGHARLTSLGHALVGTTAPLRRRRPAPIASSFPKSRMR